MHNRIYNYFLQSVFVPHPCSDYGNMFVQPSACTCSRLHSFVPSTISKWHSLPTDITYALTVSTLTNQGVFVICIIMLLLYPSLTSACTFHKKIKIKKLCEILENLLKTYVSEVVERIKGSTDDPFIHFQQLTYIIRSGVQTTPAYILFRYGSILSSFMIKDHC